MSSKHILIIVAIAALSFAYFTVGLLLIGATPTAGSVTLLVKAIVSIVIAGALVIAEVRRAQPSVGDAVLEGVRFAAVIIVVDNLTGVSDSGLKLALRGALILVGLAGLCALTHVLVRSSRPS